MAANGYAYNRPDLNTATGNMHKIADDVTHAAGAHIEDPHIDARYQNSVQLNSVPTKTVEFVEADNLVAQASAVHADLVAGAKALGGSVDLMGTALGNMIKGYDAVNHADQFNANQLQQALANAEQAG